MKPGPTVAPGERGMASTRGGGDVCTHIDEIRAPACAELKSNQGKGSEVFWGRGVPRATLYPPRTCARFVPGTQDG